MEFERRKRRHSHIDVAPLVDVVFNLLLFFVITYNVTADSAIHVRLPESVTAQTQAEESVVITLTREGNAFVGDSAVAVEDIGLVVGQRLVGSQDPSVRIKADRDVPVGLLIQVVDAVKLAGCSAFSIITERK